MRKRNIQIGVRVNEAEEARLQMLCERSGRSMSAVFRALIWNSKIYEKPSLDYIAMTKALNAIGNNLNQLAHIANLTGRINQAEYDANVENLRAMLLLIQEGFS